MIFSFHNFRNTHEEITIISTAIYSKPHWFSPNKYQHYLDTYYAMAKKSLCTAEVSIAKPLKYFFADIKIKELRYNAEITLKRCFRTCSPTFVLE